ncbi:MAG TPA: tRNA uridine-5-carboxymethylaminomethyl(34) synthesis GTPase MnmE [Verrucomicrobia subdivision 3 bacterium]|nr:tRNA uridine-5-carboxymethylaminomethyl(34) synthesis GTPase MnmE [Limisphaerales bacterium]
MNFDDTIAAIATPLGEGGLAVVRISGSQALAIADKSFLPGGKSSLKPSVAPTHTIQYGKIVRYKKTFDSLAPSGGEGWGEGDFQVVDEVLLAVLRAPRTFTREDTVEISCHGGILPAKLVLDTLLANGARLAEPGEFTRRAFLNGRIDLAQAEAVADLIHSRTELALAAANEQLAGKLSQRINKLRDDLMLTLAHVEAHIDFPDEDISPDTKEKLLQRLENGVAFMDELLRTANEGQILRRGIRAAIVGRPNAGKSSLLNQLLGRDRAIVSHIAGTTRDTIEETANVRGLPVIFIDTAGLREARDEIEVEGIRRSRESLAQAEFILHVLDASEPLTPADETYLAEFAGKKRILVRNKTDLPVKFVIDSVWSSAFRRPESPEPPEGGTPNIPIVDVCCVSGQGIEALKDAIKELVWSGEIKAEMLQVMINSRHQDALNRARTATRRTIDAFRQDATLELVALDLRIAVNAVGEIVGKTTTDDLLDSIFSQFCIGK